MANEVVVVVSGQDKTGDLFDGVTRKAGGLKGALGDVAKVAGGFLAANIIGAGFDLFKGQIGGAISGASNLEESISKVNVVFGDSAKEIQDWSQGSAKAFGQSRQSALEAVGTYGNLFQAFGVGRDEAGKMSKSMVELAADLASFNNTSVDEALAALRSGVSGETEPLKRYGVAINDVRLKEEALKMGLISSTKEALDPAAKAQASYALIMKDTSLAQGDFGRTSGGLANQQRILSAQWQDMQATIGTALLPVMTKLVTGLNSGLFPAINKISGAVQSWAGPAKAKVEEFFGAFEDSPFSTMTAQLGEMLGISNRDLGGWKQNVRAIFDELRSRIAAAFEPAKQAFVGLAEKAKESLSTIGEALASLLPTALSLAQQILPILIQMFNVWAKYVTTLATVVLDLTAALAVGVSEIIKWADESGLLDAALLGVKTIVDLVSAAVDFLAPIVKSISGFFADNKMAAIALAAALGVILVALFPIPAAIIAIITIVGLLREHWDEIKDKTREVWDSIPDPIQNAMRLIVAIVQTQWELVKNYVETAINVVRDIIKIVMALLRGDWEGAWNGIKDLVRDVWDGIVTDVSLKLGLIGDILAFAWGVISSVATAAWGELKSMFFGAMDGLFNAANDLPGRLLGLLGAWGWAALALGGAIKDGLVSAIKGGIGGLGSLYDEIWGAIKAIINSAIDAINDAIPDKIDIPFGPDINIPNNPIPRLASGARGFRGGLALLGDGGGPELAVLPPGTDVYSAGETRSMTRGEKSGIVVQYLGPVTINARDEREAEDSSQNVGWGIAQAMRARGMVA